MHLLYSGSRHKKRLNKLWNANAERKKLTFLAPRLDALHVDNICKQFESRSTPKRRQSETFLKSTNADKKSLETVFSIAICRQSGDK